MNRRLVTAALAVAAVFTAEPAAADPAPTPAPGPGFAQCGDRLVPLDLRVNVANPVGTLMYEAFLHARCAQVSTPQN
jgi:hypothetical protein